MMCPKDVTSRIYCILVIILCMISSYTMASCPSSLRDKCTCQGGNIDCHDVNLKDQDLPAHFPPETVSM